MTEFKVPRATHNVDPAVLAPAVAEFLQAAHPLSRS
jgi:hypothetical protein